MAASFPSSNPSDSTLWVAANFLSNSLNGSHDNSTNIITVLDTTGFPTSGYVVVDTEAIKYTSTTGTTFKNCTRGADSTSAATHSSGATAYQNIVADYHNALKDEVVAIATNLTNRLGGHAANITVPFLQASGSVTNPSYSWSAETTMGFWRTGAGSINLAVSATAVITFNATELRPSTNDTVSSGTAALRWLAVHGKIFQAGNGTVTNPAYSFSTNTSLGFFRIGAQQIGCTGDFDPMGAKVYDMGDGAVNLWDDCYADDWNDVADIPLFDSAKDLDGNVIPVDDLSLIRNIKPAKDKDGNLLYSDNGFSYWDDNTLPQWIFCKKKDRETRIKNQAEIIRTEDGKPSISLKVLCGLALGAVKQLEDRVAELEK